jgi:hypothetical protein
MVLPALGEGGIGNAKSSSRKFSDNPATVRAWKALASPRREFGQRRPAEAEGANPNQRTTNHSTSRCLRETLSLALGDNKRALKGKKKKFPASEMRSVPPSVRSRWPRISASTLTLLLEPLFAPEWCRGASAILLDRTSPTPWAVCITLKDIPRKIPSDFPSSELDSAVFLPA